MSWLGIAQAEWIHAEGEECWGILIRGGVWFPCLPLVSVPQGTALVHNLQLQKRLSSALVGNQGAGDWQRTFLLLAMIQGAVSYEEHVLFDCQ